MKLVIIFEKSRGFGATTGRPRRCGWFDAVVVKYAVRINGMENMAVTKIDILSGVEKLKICKSYQYQGKTINEFPNNLEILKKCILLYEELEGWKEDISQITDHENLIIQLINYVKRIEEVRNTRVATVSVGPKRSQTIIKEKVFK